MLRPAQGLDEANLYNLKRHMAIKTKIKPGIVWYKGQWRFFNEWENVAKGKYKGFVKILTATKPFHVKRMHITRYPESVKPSLPKTNVDQPWIVSITEGVKV